MAWGPLKVPHNLTPVGAPGHSLVLVAADAAQTTLAITSGTVTGPIGVAGVEWTGPRRQVQHSGPRGGLGAQAAASTLDNTTLRVTLRIWPSSMDDAAKRVSDLARVVDLMATCGGQVTVRRTGASRRHHYQVLTCDGITPAPWTPQSEIDGRTEITMTFACAPYACGDPMDIEDYWAADTRGDYTFDVGSTSNVAVSGGALVPTAPGASVVMAHTAAGYLLDSTRVVACVIPGATLAGWRAGVVLGRTSPGDRWEIYVRDNGTASELCIERFIGGSSFGIAVNPITRVKSGVPLLVIAYAKPPSQVIAGVRYVGAGGDDWTLQSPQGYNLPYTAGATGVVMTAPDTAAKITSFETFGQWVAGWSGLAQGLDFPVGDIPGDAPAAASIEFQPASASSAWALVGWAPQLKPGVNFASAGDLEAFGSFPPIWDAAGASGLTGAATLTIASSGGRSGTNALQVATTAVANRGGALRVAPPGGFIWSRTYTARVWVKSDTATTPVRMRFGFGASIASTTAVALTPGWVAHTITWTADQNRTYAWVAVEQTTAVATTWLIDQVTVFEGTTEVLSTARTPGRQGQQPVGVLRCASASWLNVGTVIVNNDIVARTSATGAVTLSASWDLDVSLIDPAVHQGGMEVEVWAALATPTTFANGKAVTVVSTGATREYGSAGVAIPAATTGLWRLGTVSIPRGRTSQILNIQISSTNMAAGNLDLSWVALIPPSSRVVTGPTGKPLDASYPRLLQASPPGAGWATRIIDADGTGAGRAPGWWTPAPAVDGTIEIPPGRTRLVIMESTLPPNIAGAGGVSGVTQARLAIVPRYACGRPAS